MNLSEFEEDTKKQKEGSPYYMGDDGAIYVKRVGTDEYNKEIEDIKREIYGFIQKDIDVGLVIGTWLAEYGVTGWENILDADDNPVKFSRSVARSTFLNPSFFNSLNAQLIAHGSSYANYLFDEVIEDVEQIKKN